MDDGFIPWPNELDINIFLNILNNMDPTLKFTLERSTSFSTDNISYQKLNFLDLSILLDNDGNIERDIYYKDTNTHDYLDYNSHHPKHIKDNVPYNLAKKIIVFCSNSVTEQKRLKELKTWLLECNYPMRLIDKKFHSAKLQGPAFIKTNEDIIPFITNYVTNFDFNNLIKNSNNLLSNTRNERLENIFKDTRTVLAYRQPKNLLRQLTKASFDDYDDSSIKHGIFKCNRKACVLCRSYIQECSSFTMNNGTEWHVKCHITCNSINTIYYLVCSCCNNTSYIGKTNNLRKRMNCHISEIRTGNTTDLFDKHVIKCKNVHSLSKEPFFKIYALITLPNEESLLTYKSHFHRLRYDSMNF